jgi:predicted RNase H-like HicB family nuclease
MKSNKRHYNTEVNGQYFPFTIARGEEGWLVAECPAIAGCVTQGHTISEVVVNLREAIACTLEAGTVPR